MKLYTADDIKPKVRRNFENIVALGPDEELVMLHDDTIFGSGKEGMAVTSQRIVRYEDDGQLVVDLPDLVGAQSADPDIDDDIHTNGMVLRVRGGDTHDIVLAGASRDEIETMLQAIEAGSVAAGASWSSDGEPTARKAPAATSGGVATKRCTACGKDSLIGSHCPACGAELTDPARIRETAAMESKEEQSSGELVAPEESVEEGLAVAEDASAIGLVVSSLLVVFVASLYACMTYFPPLGLVPIWLMGMTSGQVIGRVLASLVAVPICGLVLVFFPLLIIPAVRNALAGPVDWFGELYLGGMVRA